MFRIKNLPDTITGFLLRKLEFISDTSKDIAQVFFGVLAIESFTKDTINWNVVLWGITLSLVSWSVGIITFKTKQ